VFYDDSYEDYITGIGGIGLVGFDISQKELLVAVNEVHHGRQYLRKFELKNNFDLAKFAVLYGMHN
jgi:hypothetical protein